MEYRYKYLSRQHISIKNSCFIVGLYTTASPEEPPSETSGLRMSVQPAKPASLVGVLWEQLAKVCVFFAHKIFMTFCAPFSNRIFHF